MLRYGKFAEDLSRGSGDSRGAFELRKVAIVSRRRKPRNGSNARLPRHLRDSKGRSVAKMFAGRCTVRLVPSSLTVSVLSKVGLRPIASRGTNPKNGPREGRKRFEIRVRGQVYAVHGDSAPGLGCLGYSSVSPPPLRRSSFLGLPFFFLLSGRT